MDKKDAVLLKQAIKETKDAFTGNMSGIAEVVYVDPKTHAKRRVNLEQKQQRQQD